jgi:hypothetical protein
MKGLPRCETICGALDEPFAIRFNHCHGLAHDRIGRGAKLPHHLGARKRQVAHEPLDHVAADLSSLLSASPFAVAKP